jgi:hypothetical protein
LRLRSKRKALRCSECGASNKAARGFCTSCGKPLSPGAAIKPALEDNGGNDAPTELLSLPEDESAETLAPWPAERPRPFGPTPASGNQQAGLVHETPETVETMVAAPFASRVTQVEERPAARRRRWLPALVTTIGALALLGCALLGFLLYTERNAHTETRHELRSALVDLSSVKGDNARLEGELEATRELSERRASVLRRARSVLRGVDPLLTSVDELQGLTGDIQEARDTFASNSSELVDDLVLLANYLIDTNGYDVDYSYFSSLVDEINGELSTVRSDAYSLDGYDTDYNGATKRFDNRASGFVNAVRGLERQLKLVVEDAAPAAAEG